MIKKCVILAILSATAISMAHADSEVDPYPYITPLAGTPYYFKMIPGPFPWDTSAAKGGFYKITSGEDELLWETKGWYAYTVILASDREHMVRMGMWSMGTKPSTNHLAVAFYCSGKLVKSYSTLDLVPDTKHVSVSVSHYRWLQKIVGLEENDPENPFSPPEPPKYRLKFTIVTLADEKITFDVTTGKIVSREKQEPKKEHPTNESTPTE